MLRKINLVLCIAAGILVVQVAYGAGNQEDNRVIIFTSTEDFRTEHMQQLLDEKFPGVVTIQVLSTGNHAAKIKAEGTSTEADIILNLETGYMEGLIEFFADLSSYNTSEFLPELIPAHRKYLPWDKSSGAIIFSRKNLAAKGLPVPSSYNDLLNPVYKGTLSMPNPKSSGTGYMFLKSLVNAWGEAAAFAYFDRFAENVLQFTSSGSGPVNALLQGEAAIGLGMTITAVQAINTRGADFETLFFKEGAPHTTTGMAVIKGKDVKPVVKDVFQFIITRVVKDDNDLYCPEAIFKNSVNKIPNYPKDIPYADMTGITNLAEKEKLLAKWKY